MSGPGWSEEIAQNAEGKATTGKGDREDNGMGVVLRGPTREWQSSMRENREHGQGRHRRNATKTIPEANQKDLNTGPAPFQGTLRTRGPHRQRWGPKSPGLPIHSGEGGWQGQVQGLGRGLAVAGVEEVLRAGLAGGGSVCGEAIHKKGQTERRREKPLG